MIDATTGRKEALDNKCLTSNIIYEAQITSNTNDEHKEYLGITKTSLKERYSDHTRDFKHRNFKVYLEFEQSRYNTHS